MGDGPGFSRPVFSACPLEYSAAIFLFRSHQGPGPSGRPPRRGDVGLFHLGRAENARLSWEKIVTQSGSIDIDGEVLPPPHKSRRTADTDAARERLEALARTLDSAVRIPGTSIRIGADAALNLIPGLGTLA
ncbi:MAG: DUF4112 domain-containing protein, partial [Azospirillum sp.]|nr:DUF4112 domain-containing protein [Azospirillum sp.]